MAFKKSHPTPKVGAVFQHNYKGTIYNMVVVQTDEGVGYRVGEKTYSSPTAAAKAIVGQNQFVNGRKFWHLEESE